MADLDEKNASGSSKLTGANSSGLETNFVGADANGDLQTSDSLRGTGTQGAVSLGTTAVEVRVGGSKLANRKAVTVYNNSNKTIYWGYTSGVTKATGTPIIRNSAWSWDINDGAGSTLYIIADDTGLDIRITEGA